MEDETDPLGSTTVLPTNAFEERPADQLLQVGTVLRDRFMLMEEVAGGSMGTVYKALDRRLAEADAEDHWVAIKVLAPELSNNGDALRALQQEAVKTRCLSHPNIVRFIDLDRDDNLYFMVMEWLDGSSLSDVLNQNTSKKLDLDTALDIIKQIASALDYAHQRGIVHADVKPGNIMMMPSGKAKLFDFGVARIRQKQHASSRDFDPVVLNAATPAYSSMQVLTGDVPVAADDVFSLACLAYRLIAGYRVFGPRDAAQAAEEGMDPQAIECLSKAQWQAMKKALAFSRVTRFSTPAEFVAAFIPATEDSVVKKDPVMTARRFDDVALDEDDTIEVLFESPGGKRGWLVAAVLIIAVAGAYLRQDDLRELWDTYAQVNIAEPTLASEADKPLARPVEEITVNSIATDSRQPASIEPLPGEEEYEPVLEPQVSAGEAQSVALANAGLSDNNEADTPVIAVPAKEETSALDFETPPSANIIIPIPALGAPAEEYYLTLVEDDRPAIIDFVRESNLDERLRLRLVNETYSFAERPLASDQLQISNNGSVVFPVGQHRARVIFTMTSDPLREPDQERTLVLLDADYSDIEFAKIKLSLLDDDQRRFENSLAVNTIAFAVSQVSVRERDPAVQIDVIRFKPDDKRIDVDYVIRDVTATEGEDYIAPGTGTISFAPGQRVARILIPVVQDNKRESDEAFMLELLGDSGPAQNNIYRRIAVMIRDDDS